MFEAVQLYGWVLHAYVIMRNHYHVAVETPRANLVEGMHWLQSTFAARFNRFRKANGHVFQGRYKAILLEDATALARVVDYIHLNPVRAGVVATGQASHYAWSSLRRLRQNKRGKGMSAKTWLEARGGWSDNARGLAAYEKHLAELAASEQSQKDAGIEGGRLSRGWAIGTHGWRQALARDYAQKALSVGMERKEMVEMREARWRQWLDKALKASGKSEADLITRPRSKPWKIRWAARLRAEEGASIVWMSRVLHLGKPASLSSYLSRLNHAKKNQETSA